MGRLIVLKKRINAAVLRAAAAVLVMSSSAACSPAGSDAVDGNVVTIKGVDVPLSFEPKEVELDAGRYEIHFRNEGMLPHQLAVGSPDDDGKYADGDTRQVAAGEKAGFTITVEKGRYAFACSTWTATTKLA